MTLADRMPARANDGGLSDALFAGYVDLLFRKTGLSPVKLVQDRVDSLIVELSESLAGIASSRRILRDSIYEKI